MINIIYQLPIRVYFEDTDAGGVVYYARYAAFYERARTEMWRQHGIDNQQLIQKNISFAVRKITVEYLLPARLDEQLEVQSRLTLIRGASLSYAQQIVDINGRVLNKADVVVACVDLQKMKPVALPGAVIEVLKRNESQQKEIL